MPSYTIISLAALAAVAQALTVTSPTETTLWDSSEDNTITWTTVSTDPTTADIYLVHQASQPQISDLLFSDVDLSSGSVTVSGLQLPTGSAYQINFVKPDTTAQIYAQSNQFNVTGQAVDATSTLAGYTGPTATPSSPSSTSSTSSSSSSSSSSGSSSASSATTESSGSSSLTSSSVATGTASTTLTTSTGTASTTGTASSNKTTSTGTATASGTSTATGTSASSSASSTANAAPGLAASAPLAALVFGAVAMFA